MLGRCCIFNFECCFMCGFYWMSPGTSRCGREYKSVCLVLCKTAIYLLSMGDI